MSEERGHERVRLLRLAVALGSAERVITSICSAARVSLFLYGLTTRDYGLYVVVLSVVATAHLLDFGLHNGALTAIAAANGRDDKTAIRAVMSTATVIYSSVATAALAVLVPLVWLGPTARVLGVAHDQAHDARWLATFGVLSLVLSLPLKIVSALLAGLQHNFLTSAFRTIAALASTAVLAIAVFVLHGRLMAIAAATSAADVIFLAIFGGWVLCGRYSEFRPAAEAVSLPLVRPLLTSGSTFLITNLANLLRRSVPPIWLARELGTSAVPTFSVTFSLFVIALSFSDLVAGSLWPAWGEAVARGDWDWVRRTFRNGATGAIAVATMLAVLGAVLGADVIALWTPKVPSPSASLLALLAVWLFSQTVFYFCYAMLNGVGQNRLVMWTLLAEGGAVLVLGLFATRWFGAEGMGATIALCGIGGSAALVALVHYATSRRVRFPVLGLIRIGLIAVLAYFGGWSALGQLNELSPLLRVVLVAPPLAALYAALAWRVALSAEARSGLKNAIRRRGTP